MTKNDIVVRIAKTTGLRQIDVKRIAQMTLEGIIDALVEKGRIELRNFGVFEVRTRKSRRARNPRTGQEVIVPSRKVVSFKPGKLMEVRVSKERSK